MASNYSYKKSIVTVKKMAGTYDSDEYTITTDDEQFDLLRELKDFEGAEIEITVKVKEARDLAEY